MTTNIHFSDCPVGHHLHPNINFRIITTMFTPINGTAKCKSTKKDINLHMKQTFLGQHVEQIRESEYCRSSGRSLVQPGAFCFQTFNFAYCL